MLTIAPQFGIATTSADELRAILGESAIAEQATADGIPTFWVAPEDIRSVLGRLKTQLDRPYRMLYDLTAVDERMKAHPQEVPVSDFTVVYHLLSFDRNEFIRIKSPLKEGAAINTITGLWPAANWYEREVWDMFGIRFHGHPHLERILMPRTWIGHPLRKDHPARVTEMGPFHLPDAKQDAEQEALRFRPEEWGMKPGRDGQDFLFLNLGPQHPGTHGVLRVILQLDGEEIVDAVPDIGFHHRGAEKMGERQSWHTYIPYTDRIDYLGGVMNNMAYLMALEKLAGIRVPARAQVIRVMLAEVFRIVTSTFGLFYYLRVVTTLFHQPVAEGQTPEPLPRRAPAVSLVLAALSVFLVGLGVFPAPLLHLIQSTIGSIF